MCYNIYVNGELVSTELSLDDLFFYLQTYDLQIIDEDENMEVNNNYVDVYCEEC